MAKRQVSEQRGAHISCLPGQEPKAPRAELTWGPAHKWDELSCPLPPAQGLGQGCRYRKPRTPRAGRGCMSRLIPQAELLHKGWNTCGLLGETINNICARIPAPEPVGLGSHAHGKLGLGRWGLLGWARGAPRGRRRHFRED